MRILHITPWFQPAWRTGGTATSSSQICKSLAYLGLDITVFTTTDSGRDEPLYLDDYYLEKDNVKIYYFKCGLFNLSFRKAAISFSFLIAIFKNINKYDLVHIHSTRHIYGLLVFYLCKIKKIPYFLTPHGSLMDSWMKNIGNIALKKFYHKFVDSFIINGASAVHLLSDLELKESSKWIKNKNKIVINNGIDIHLKKNKKISTISKPIKLVQIGRIHPQKNNLELIKALIRFSEDEFTLDIFGPVDDYEYFTKCKKLLNSNNVKNIRFLGYLDNKLIKKIYFKYDLLCMPSLVEASSIVLIEAFSSGLPALISHEVGTSKEILQYNAGLKSGTSCESIYFALNRLRKEPQILKLLSLNAEKLCSENYDSISNCKKLISYYKKFINN